MIDKTKYFWTGDSADDITEYLQEYTELPDIDVKSVVCHECGGNIFELKGDQDEGAVQIKCSACNRKKIILDCEEIWKDVSHKTVKCPICKAKGFNIKVGFVRRENGDAKWVYIGERCVSCETLMSSFDWKIDYSPTTETENNI